MIEISSELKQEMYHDAKTYGFLRYLKIFQHLYQISHLKNKRLYSLCLLKKP